MSVCRLPSSSHSSSRGKAALIDNTHPVHGPSSAAKKVQTIFVCRIQAKPASREMAPPATKRRKLGHSGSEEDSESSFAEFDNANGVELEESDAEEGAAESDVSMNGADELTDEEDASDDEEESRAEEKPVQKAQKSASTAKASTASKPLKRPAASLQDGVYTAETFKSNIFKLQVDELLDQIKLKYGKKEAPAETAMRTLKSIIEHIPSRAALPVRPDVYSP